MPVAGGARGGGGFFNFAPDKGVLKQKTTDIFLKRKVSSKRHGMKISNSQVRELATKPGSLSLVSRTHMVGKK